MALNNPDSLKSKQNTIDHETTKESRDIAIDDSDFDLLIKENQRL